eukprot:328448_1
MAAIPVTPPLQTRPNLHTYLSQTSSNTATTDNNDDAKSHNTSGKTDGGSSAVISIHNLILKTKLSPDDAAWLHSKIDQVTHDQYDGSLSYIGPAIRGRARSHGLMQQMSFEDDAATVATNRSGHSIVLQHQHKRMRKTLRSKSSTSIPRKPFRDSYLRPIIASQHKDNEPRKPSTPKAKSPSKQPDQPSAAQRNGFHFDKHENTNNKVTSPSQNVTRVGMVATVVTDHGLGSLKPSDASSSSENVDMEVDKK